MSKIAVVTDTNSGITREEAKKLGVYLLPMPFIVDGTEYFEGVTCTYEHFFEMLEAGAEVSTSQPSPESLTAMWEEALATHDSVVHIPMSSALSGSCDTAKALAAEYNGRVCVVDNKRISITQRESVLDALTLAEKGLTAAEICVQLESTAYNASIYLAVNTLELLKKERPCDAGRGGARDAAGPQARFADSGRQAGRLREGARHGKRRKNDAEGARKRPANAFCRQKGAHCGGVLRRHQARARVAQDNTQVF